MPNRRVQRKSSLGIELTPQWVAWGIVIALILHLALFILLRSMELRRFGEAYYEKIVPRSFKLKRVEIDPALLEEEDAEKVIEEAKRAAEAIVLPKEAPAVVESPREVRLKPDAERPLDLTAVLTSEKPTVNSTIEEVLAAARPAGAASQVSPDLPELDIADLEAGAGSPDRPSLILPPSQRGEGAQSTDGPDFTNLDALLAQSGPVGDNQPILMDAGLLFDYDSAELSPAASTDLAKVAALISRSPGATIIIEGHTDSFGTDDYNYELSRQRALSVKQWLVEKAGIPSDRIATTGFGKTRLIAPATGSIEEQQINRRVEITIKRL